MGRVIGVSHEIEDSPTLNCDHANLSALMQFYGEPVPTTAFGCQWHFGLRGPDELPDTLRVPTLEAIRRQTGFVFADRILADDDFVDTVVGLVEGGVPVMVYGNQFHMHWVPYYQHEVASHPFIVDGLDGPDRFHVLEAYRNTSDWGDCLPVELWIDRDTLVTAVSTLEGPLHDRVLYLSGRVDPVDVDLLDHVVANAEGLAARVGEAGELAAFAERARASARDLPAVKLFDLACWEVIRARSCHLRWLERVAAVDDRLPQALVERFTTEVVTPWQRVSQFAHIGFKRVEAGSRPPQVSFDMIEQLAGVEVALSQEVAATVGQAGRRPDAEAVAP